MGLFYCYHNDMNLAIENGSTIIQSLAIIIGWLRAYRKFWWERKAENTIKLKTLLMDYREKFSWAASQYRLDAKESEESARTKFALSILPSYNKLLNHIQLSLYVPKDIRKKIPNILRLSLWENSRPKGESLSKKREQFEKDMKYINEQLDNIIDNL